MLDNTAIKVDVRNLAKTTNGYFLWITKQWRIYIEVVAPGAIRTNGAFVTKFSILVDP